MVYRTVCVEINEVPILRLTYHDIPPRDINISQRCFHTLRICYIRQGKGIWTIGQRNYDITVGDIFILNNNEYRAIQTVYPPEHLIMMVIDFEPWFIWAGHERLFDDRYLKVFFERKEDFDNRLKNEDTDACKIRDLMLEIEEEISNRLPEYEQMVKVKLLNILVNLNRYYNSMLNTTTMSPTSSLQCELISNALNYINEHLAENLSLEVLANIVHMNPCGFSKLFKKYNGIGFSQYIIKKRIQKSLELLKNTNIPVLEVATQCGFNSITNFYKAFNNLTDTLPSYYRNNQKASGKKSNE